MADDALLLRTAQELYALPLAEFTPSRNTRAAELRQAGQADEARVVGAFKKPSAGAHAVNQLIGHDDGLPREIADLGPRLRAAQATADAAGLRELDRERRALVNRARDAARKHLKGATAATLNDVEQTVWAALVDTHAATIVRAGVLVRALSPGGFGEVDTDGASPVPLEAQAEDIPPRRRAKPADPGATQKADKKAVEEAKAALAVAQDEARAAQQELDEASRSADEAAARHGDLEDERDDLRDRLTAVEKGLREAKADIAESRTALRQAERKRRAASAEVDRAVRRVDQASSGPD
jgi:hypothetical protein